MPDETDNTSSGNPGPPAGRGRLRRVKVGELMGGAREIVLEFEQQDYRLRITSKGKLILTK